MLTSSFSFSRKLKRDSAPYESDITDTDRLLLQKDEEVGHGFDFPISLILHKCDFNPIFFLDSSYARDVESDAGEA